LEAKTDMTTKTDTSMEKVLQRTMYQSTQQPVQVRLHGQNGDIPTKPVIFEAADGAYYNTVVLKRAPVEGELTDEQLQDLEVDPRDEDPEDDNPGRRVTWTKIILRTKPACGFLFPGPFTGFQDNKTKHLSIYLKKRLVIYAIIAGALELGQLWYLLEGRFDEDVGPYFWNDPWLRPAVAFCIPWAYIMWAWNTKDTDLKVIYLQGIQDLDREKGRIFRVCTRVMAFYTILEDLGVQGLENAREALDGQIATIAERNEPEDNLALRDKVVELQSSRAHAGNVSLSKEEEERDRMVKTKNAETLRAAVLLGMILAFGALFFWLWLTKGGG